MTKIKIVPTKIIKVFEKIFKVSRIIFLIQILSFGLIYITPNNQFIYYIMKNVLVFSFISCIVSLTMAGALTYIPLWKHIKNGEEIDDNY